jgi:hypothetical protein
MALVTNCLSVYLPVCLSVCLPACLSICLSICLSACLSVCLSVCLYLRDWYASLPRIMRGGVMSCKWKAHTRKRTRRQQFFLYSPTLHLVCRQEFTSPPTVLLLHCCYTVVTLLLHCCYTVATLLLHCCYTVVTLLLHCCYTVVSLLLHCCYTVVTLLLHCCDCCYTVVDNFRQEHTVPPPARHHHNRYSLTPLPLLSHHNPLL